MGCTGLSGGVEAEMGGDRGRSKVLTSCVRRRQTWCPEQPVLVPVLVCGSHCEASLLSGQGGPCKGHAVKAERPTVGLSLGIKRQNLPRFLTVG